MIYSPRVFSDKTRILSCIGPVLLVGDYEYLRIIIIKHPKFFKVEHHFTYPYHDLSENIKDIIKRQTFKEHRNTRDNIAKIRENRFKIWRIGHYQKNEYVIGSLLSMEPRAIGLIPEEVITQENTIECVTRDISSLDYLSEEITEREIRITKIEAIILRRRIKTRILREDDRIKLSDLIK